MSKLRTKSAPDRIFRGVKEEPAPSETTIKPRVVVGYYDATHFQASNFVNPKCTMPKDDEYPIRFEVIITIENGVINGVFHSKLTKEIRREIKSGYTFNFYVDENLNIKFDQI